MKQIFLSKKIYIYNFFEIYLEILYVNVKSKWWVYKHMFFLLIKGHKSYGQDVILKEVSSKS